MSPRTLFLFICVGSVLLGCATSRMDFDGRTLRCHGQGCNVQVFVSCTGAACTASVDADTVQVPRGNSPKITWELTHSNYSFQDNGIVIANSGAEFACHVEAGGRRFACNNRHTTPGRYKYTINVRGSPAVPPLDPFIAND